MKPRLPAAQTRPLKPGATEGRAISPPIWNKEPYAVIQDGRLLVRVVGMQGPEWVRKYQRWSIRLECQGVFEPVNLSLFINLGGDQRGPGVPGRQSKFYKHWMMANGEQPKKGQPMNFDVFLDKFFMAEVEKVTKDSSGEVKGEEEIYSRIRHFVRREEM